MNTKLFGQFLLEKGYVTREQLLQGLAAQREAARTLGDLAVATGMLALKEVDAIHLLQHVENKPFSQAAVELGLLTEKQIAELLHPHSAERLLLGQVLMAFGHLDEPTLNEALAGHEGDRTGDECDLMAHFRGSDLVEVGPTCISIMRHVFKKSLRAPLSLQSVPPSKAVSANQTVWSQTIARGDERFILSIQVGETHGSVIAESVLGMPLKRFDDLARDAVGEFLNVVTGHVCANLDGGESGLSATPPLVQHPLDFLDGARPGISLLCTSDQTEFSYVIARPVKRVAGATPTAQPGAGASGQRQVAGHR